MIEGLPRSGPVGVRTEMGVVWTRGGPTSSGRQEDMWANAYCLSRILGKIKKGEPLIGCRGTLIKEKPLLTDKKKKNGTRDRVQRNLETRRKPLLSKWFDASNGEAFGCKCIALNAECPISMDLYNFERPVGSLL